MPDCLSKTLLSINNNNFLFSCKLWYGLFSVLIHLSGPKKEKGRKYQSATDVRTDAGSTTPPSPPPMMSRRRRLWSSFRNKARRLRGKTKERPSSAEFNRLSASQPNIASNGSAIKGDEFDAYFESSKARHRESSKERSMSDPTLTPQTSTRSVRVIHSDHGMGDEAEVDSGIAVIEQMSTTPTTTVSDFYGGGY